MKKTSLKVLACAIALPLTGLIVHVSAPTIASEEAPAWSYGGASNPTQWGDSYELCEVGRDQSPIDIDATDANVVSPTDITFDYSPTPLAVKNNGHTIQVDYAPGSSITIGDQTYSLLQFHFHTPSEHTIEGEAAAMEVHFVHANEDEELAVVGVMMTVGEADPAIASIWENIPAEEGVNTAEGDMINAADLLPSDTTYFNYAGSLTTPPCSEEVKWHVLSEPITVSAEQVDAFASLYQVNARPVQDVNGRQVNLHE